MQDFLKSHDGLDIHYAHTKGSSTKPVLIFLHGLGANVSEWKKMVVAAKTKGYATLAIDLRGHGLSSSPEEFLYYHLDELSKDLKNILLKLKIKNFVLVGHSFGGSVAIAFCTKYLDSSLKALVLIESTHKYPYKKYHELNSNPLVCFVIRTLIGWNILTNKNFPKIPELDLTHLQKENALFQVYDELYHTPFKVLLQCLDAAKDFSITKEKKIHTTLKNIRSPTLLITGSSDKIVDPKYSYELNKLIPSSELKVFKTESHQLPLEYHALLNKEIFSFLERAN